MCVWGGTFFLTYSCRVQVGGGGQGQLPLVGYWERATGGTMESGRHTQGLLAFISCPTQRDGLDEHP